MQSRRRRPTTLYSTLARCDAHHKQRTRVWILVSRVDSGVFAQCNNLRFKLVIFRTIHVRDHCAIIACDTVWM